MPTDNDLRPKLRMLIGARVVFTGLLLGSTLYLHLGRGEPESLARFGALYALIAGILLMSAIYGLILGHVRNLAAFASVQLVGDTLAVTAVLHLTGGFSSLFTFLYLVVIVTSSLLLPRRGTLLVAALCSIQYGLLLDLEYFGLIRHLSARDGIAAV